MTLRVAQITDCHLQADPTTPYKGVDADAHLDQCLAWLQDHAQVDVLLLTGDLSHFGSLKAYQRLQQKLTSVLCPSIWLAGNHDDCQAMQQVCNQPVQELRVFDYKHWQVLAINTTAKPDGAGGGSVSDQQMKDLATTLEQNHGKPVCLFMHHNAVPVNSAWQDNIMLANASEFNALIAANPQVKMVVCGHVHQEIDEILLGTRFLATPSSAVQFACHQQQFKVQEELGPGLRLLTLMDDGQAHSQVVRLPKIISSLLANTDIMTH